MKTDSRKRCSWAAWLAWTLAVVLATSAAAEAPRIAVFGFELIDTSLEGEISGPRADEQERLIAISDQLRRELTESGRYTLVDIAPMHDRIEKAGMLHGCNGCEADIARALGAECRGVGALSSNDRRWGPDHPVDASVLPFAALDPSSATHDTPDMAYHETRE